MRGLGWVLLLAIFVIYVVLGILYEASFTRSRFSRASPPPFRRAADAAALQAGPEHLRVCRVIMLVGLVKKNGIMMIDFAIEARRERHLSAADAIYEACMVRFRPIMMTTMAALMGTLRSRWGGDPGRGAASAGLAVVEVCSCHRRSRCM